MRARFNGIDGRDFLEQIFYSGDLDYYRTRSLKAIIQHFYSTVSYAVYTFLVLHIIDFLSIAFVGNYMENIAEEIQYKRQPGATVVSWNDVTKANERVLYGITTYQVFFIILTIINEITRFTVAIRCRCKKVTMKHLTDLRLLLLIFELITKLLIFTQVGDVFFGNPDSIRTKQFDVNM